MENNQGDEPRNVVPRWRSSAALPSWEIRPAREAAGLEPITPEDFADDLELWRADASLASYVDIFDTGVLLDDMKLQMEGAGPILANAKTVPTRLLESVRRSVAPGPDLERRRYRFSRLEQNENYLIATLRRLKRRLIDYPTDALASMEAARLHVLLGQYEAAERYVLRSLSLSPSSRLMLRAATQFFHISNQTEMALHFLRRSDGIKYDPLLQSAEVAVAQISGRGSRYASSALRMLKGSKDVGVSRSELALAIATLEMSAGVAQRRVFQMVRSGLPHGTENAVAQAVWLGEQTERSLQVRYPDLRLADDAFEAKAVTLNEEERYDEAVIQARLWLLDQPFDPDPSNMLCTIYSIYLQSPKSAVPFAQRAVQTHPKDWSVLNSALLVYSLSGLFKDSRDTLQMFEKLATNSTIRAFYYAAEGMLSFCIGDIANGRRNYEKAILEARKSRRPDLVFSASIFLLWGESRNGMIDITTFDRLSDRVVEAVSKLPYDNREYASKLWRAISKSSAQSVIDSEVNPVASSLEKADCYRILEHLPENLELPLV